MPAYNETIDDFNLKWANTYALYQQKLVFVHPIEFSEDEEETSSYSVLLYHSNKVKEHLTNFDLNILTPIVVNSSLFNSRPLTDLTSAVSTQDPTCLRISRRARRMNKRSLCDEQNKLSSPAMYFMSKVAYKLSKTLAFSFQKIEHLLKNEYPAYQQAFDILSGHIMLALSSDFAIMASHIDSDQCLFASQWGFIGTATPTEIIVHHKPSYQEVCDFVRRKHLEVSVKCH